MSKLKDLESEQKSLRKVIKDLQFNLDSITHDIKTEKNKGPKWATNINLIHTVNSDINAIKNEGSEILTLSSGDTDFNFYIDDCVSFLKFLQEQIILPEDKDYTTDNNKKYPLGGGLNDVVTFYEDGSMEILDTQTQLGIKLFKKEAIYLNSLMNKFDFGKF